MNQDETTAPEKQGSIPTRPGRGTMVLVLGILSIVLSVMFCALLGPALGIPAWTMGQRDEREIQKGLIHPSERSLTRAGKICGIFGTFVGIGLLILAILIPIIVLSFLLLVGISFASCCSL